MITMTLNKAKARLHKLVEAAEAGEQVVLLRGSEVVATLTPLRSEDLEIAPQLTDAQARRFWEKVHRSPVKSFPTPGKAVAFLKKPH